MAGHRGRGAALAGALCLAGALTGCGVAAAPSATAPAAAPVGRTTRGAATTPGRTAEPGATATAGVPTWEASVCRAADGGAFARTPFSAGSPGARVPAGFAARAVVSCVTDQRRRPDGATELVGVERLADDPAAVAAYAAAVRLPDGPPPVPGTGCLAVGYPHPWVFLLDAGDTPLRPRQPRTGCGAPRREVTDAFAALPFRTVDSWPIAELESAEAARTGCGQQMADLVRVAAVLGPTPRPVRSDPFGSGEVRVCTYRVPASERGTDKPGGEFTSGTRLSGPELTRLGDLLRGTTAAVPCAAEATRFAVLSPAGAGASSDGPTGYVELDGCRRVLLQAPGGGQTWGRAAPGLAELLGG